MRIRMIITALMLMVSMGMDAQIRVGYQTDTAKIAEYRSRRVIEMNTDEWDDAVKNPPKYPEGIVWS